MGYTDKNVAKWYKREYYLDNKDEVYWRTVVWRATHPERLAEIRRAYYEKTKEWDAKRKKIWAKKNPEKYKAANKRSWERRRIYRNAERKLKYKLDKMFGVKKK